MGRNLGFKGRQFTAAVILWAVRWYLMFPISYRDLELMLLDCQSALNIGSGSKLMQDQRASRGAKKASFEQIKTGAAIHLALHQFQFGVLPFGLAIRPWFGESRLHRVLILDDPRGE